MKKTIELQTKRLKLRQWKQEDYEAFGKLNADSKVMEYFPSILTKVQSDVMASTLKALISEEGWGFWVLEEKKIDYQTPNEVYFQASNNSNSEGDNTLPKVSA